MDFSADATSVNHDHSYFCSQEQANTNGSNTMLPKGKCSMTCQTELTANEINYSDYFEKCRRKNRKLSEKPQH